MIETEIKYYSSPENFEDFINKGYEYLYESEEVNHLFNGGNLSKDEVLRLRTEKSNGQWKTELTYKSPNITENGIKTRAEFNATVDGIISINQILEALGYESSLCYEKKRKVYHDPLSACDFMLDILPFGYFIEIEGTAEGILTFQKNNSEHLGKVCNKSYPELTKEFNPETLSAKFLTPTIKK